jgi:hypothetical protein
MYATLIDPPYEFALNNRPPLVVTALQLEQAAPLTLTLKPLAVVAPQLLLVLLLAPWLTLHAYPPMYATFIDPPYEFTPKDWTPLVVTALQLEQAAPLTLTLKPLAVVAPQLLLVLLLAPLLKLHAYPPI